jgi:hypothetical protein
VAIGEEAADWARWAVRAVDTLTMTPGASDEAWVNLFAPGGTYEDPVTGRTADVASVFDVTRTSFPDWKMTVTSSAGNRRGGVVEWTSHGHLPHGPEVVLHGCSVIDLSSEGKILRWRDYFDMGEFDRQTAATPE